jgi:peroxiredoxin
LERDQVDGSEGRTPLKPLGCHQRLNFQVLHIKQLQSNREYQMSSPAVGSVAPDFELTNQHGQKVSLASFRDKKNVVVLFYPFAFSGICTGELCALRDDLAPFQNDQVELLAISCDPMYSLKAFADAEKYEFSLLADFWPHGEVAKKYGVFQDERGFSTRGTFVIDKSGVIRWSVVNGPGEARDVAAYKAALAAI